MAKYDDHKLNEDVEGANYLSMEELDEENINWGKLCTRIVSIFLLVVIIICASIGAIYKRLYILAALVSVALVCCFGCSFLDMEVCKSRTREVFRLDNIGNLPFMRHEETASQLHSREM